MSDTTSTHKQAFGYGIPPSFTGKPRFAKTVIVTDDVEVDVNSLYPAPTCYDDFNGEKFPVKRTKKIIPIVGLDGKIAGYCEQLRTEAVHPTIARWDETVDAQTAPIDEGNDEWDFLNVLCLFLFLWLGPMLIYSWIYSLPNYS